MTHAGRTDLAGLVRGVLAASLLLMNAVAADGQEARSGGSPAKIVGTGGSVPANIQRDTTLSGEFALDGGISIARGVTLRLAAGTRLTVPADRDEDARQPAIHVHGRIVASGTAARPVLIEAPGKAAWRGVLLHKDRMRGSDESQFRHTRFVRAVAGLQVARGDPVIEDCVFVNCNVGLIAGFVRSASRKYYDRPNAPTPVVRRCVFVSCRVGVSVESNGAPEILRTLFLRNEVGVGQHGLWDAMPVTGLGAVVSRCAFEQCTDAVVGSSVVEDSLFVGNNTAYRVSQFHGPLSQNVDRFCWRRNVFHDNRLTAAGESDLGADNVWVAPGLPPAPEPGAPLTELYEALARPLPQDSPARGTSTDGGDPGPTGRIGRGLRLTDWTRRPGTAAWAYAIRVQGAGRGPRLRPDGGPVGATSGRGRALWARFETDELGGLSLPFSEAPVAVSYPFRLDTAAELALEIGYDGSATATLDGRPLELPAHSQRLRSQGTRVTARCDAGEHELRVVWERPEAGCRLAVDLGPGPSQVEYAPPDPVPFAWTSIRSSGRRLAFRVTAPFHWGRWPDSGWLTLRRGSGEEIKLSRGAVTTDARGTVFIDLPRGVSRTDVVAVVNSVPDSHGRTMSGLPEEIRWK